jgi:HSP20 family protein
MKLPIRRETASQDKRAARDDVDQLTRSFAGQLERWPDFFQPLADVMRSVLPLADVEETDTHYVVEIELPGVKREDISLEVTSDHLVVSGERRERQRAGLLRQQTRTTGKFHYEVTLPSDVDTESVSAHLDNGVLTVVVPKIESARPRKIAISTDAGRQAITS